MHQRQAEIRIQRGTQSHWNKKITLSRSISLQKRFSTRQYFGNRRESLVPVIFGGGDATWHSVGVARTLKGLCLMGQSCTIRFVANCARFSQVLPDLY